jgi:hypothetical protein
MRNFFMMVSIVCVWFCVKPRGEHAVRTGMDAAESGAGEKSYFPAMRMGIGSGDKPLNGG